MGINLSAWYEALGMVFLHTDGHQHALQQSPLTEPRATWSHAVPARGPMRRNDWRRTPGPHEAGPKAAACMRGAASAG